MLYGPAWAFHFLGHFPARQQWPVGCSVAEVLYCRFGANTLRRYKFKFPEDIDEDKVKLVYRTTYSGKLHYWDYTNNYPGHVREDSDVRPLTKEQEACLTKLLEDFIENEKDIVS